MELVTDAPTGTKLRIDADRQFEGQQGDSVLRVQGERPEGGQVFDATYVEVDDKEAYAIAQLIRTARQPTPELMDTISREVQAMFGSRLSGRDAQQIAQTVGRAWWDWLGSSLSVTEEHRPQYVEALAERFERAAAKKRTPPAFTQPTGGDGGTSGRRSQG